MSSLLLRILGDYLYPMPVNEKYLAAFEASRMYHVYNRTNNKELLFLSDDNRSFFLKQFLKYLSPFLDVHSWCLLPNHFHFLIAIKSIASIRENLQRLSGKELSAIQKSFLQGEMTTQQQEMTSWKKKMSSLATVHDLVESAFRAFFISYSTSFNRAFKRTGNLFQRPFKRVLIDDDHQYTQTIIYIHANPLKHKITNDFTTYAWSSYRDIINSTQRTATQESVINWFGNLDRFVRDHHELSRIYEESNVAFEDD